MPILLYKKILCRKIWAIRATAGTAVRPAAVVWGGGGACSVGRAAGWRTAAAAAAQCRPAERAVPALVAPPSPAGPTASVGRAAPPTPGPFRRRPATPFSPLPTDRSNRDAGLLRLFPQSIRPRLFVLPGCQGGAPGDSEPYRRLSEPGFGSFPVLGRGTLAAG